ncbi:MAG: Rv1733c family protein [Streptosporangiaceae bacterium]
MTGVITIMRGLWPDHNPLRRATDRAEAGMFAGLAVAFLLGAPLIAMTVWHLAFATAFTTRNAEHAGWRPVPARLLADAPQSYGHSVAVPARWQAPDGTARSGRIPARPGARAGTTVTVWTAQSGWLTRTPMSAFQAAFQADVTAIMAVPCWAMLLLAAGVLSHRLLDARRLAAWDAE